MEIKPFFINNFECFFDKSILNQSFSLHYKNNIENIDFEVQTIHYITEEDFSETVSMSFFHIYEILLSYNLWDDKYLNLTVKNFLETIDSEVINDAYADEVADTPL